MLQGIRKKIISHYLLLIIISMSVLGMVLFWMVQKFLISSLEDDMINQAWLVSDLVKDQITLGRFSEIDNEAKFLRKKLQARITVVLINGKVIADTDFNPAQMENHGQRPEIRKALDGQVGVVIRLSSTSGRKTMYVAVPVESGGKLVGVARISHALLELRYTFLKLFGILLTGILITSCIAFLISLKLARRLTQPIENISLGAQKIAAGDLDTRVYAGSEDEIGDLGVTINTMTKTLREHIEEISQEKSRLENILYTIVSGVIVLDQFGVVQIVNPAAEEMFGIFKVTAEGRHSIEVIRHYGLNEEIEKCLTQEKIIDYEFSLRFPEEKVLKCYIAPVYREKRIAGITIVFHDITKIRKLEQMRADFVANASHELRTPLTVIKGYIETLLNGALDDRAASEKFIAVIDQEADRLKRLVDELLTLSQLESHHEDKIEQPVDLKNVIRQIVEEMKPRVAEKQMTLHIDLPPELPAVNANQDQLKQILVNLLDNAVKYTSPGGNVTIFAIEERNNVKISVKDTGMGIPSNELSRIFERFYRVDKARSRKMGGFGLGLSIVKHMVENMGGNIGVESKLNEGSIFWFTLPKHVK